MDVLRRVDIKVANSSMLEAVMHQLNAESIKQQQSRDLTKLANPALHAFQKAGNPLLEKLLETMSESLEDYGQESWKWTQWNRSLQKVHNITFSLKFPTRNINRSGTVCRPPASEEQSRQRVLTRHPLCKRYLQVSPTDIRLCSVSSKSVPPLSVCSDTQARSFRSRSWPLMQNTLIEIVGYFQ